MAELNDWDVVDANNDSAPPDGWPENTMNYSEVNNTGRAVQGKLKRFYADMGGALTTGGTSTAYTLTLNASYTAYFNGMMFVCTANVANTGACTMNVNSIGAVSMKDAEGNALPAGAIGIGDILQLHYKNSEFLVLNIRKTMPSLVVQTDTASINGFQAVRKYTPGAISVNSGTSVDIDTTLPSWVTMIKVLISNIDVSTTGNILIQAGDATAWKTTGYAGLIQKITTTTASSESLSSGVSLTTSAPNTLAPILGVVNFYKMPSGNIWVADHRILENFVTNVAYYATSRFTLTGNMTRLRIQSGGFDGSGTVAIQAYG